MFNFCDITFENAKIWKILPSSYLAVNTQKIATIHLNCIANEVVHLWLSG
jgi:hypothetical protein